MYEWNNVAIETINHIQFLINKGNIHKLTK